jgi:hypothetical protein
MAARLGMVHLTLRSAWCPMKQITSRDGKVLVEKGEQLIKRIVVDTACFATGKRC